MSKTSSVSSAKSNHYHSHRTKNNHHKVSHHVVSPQHIKFIADASGAAQQSEITTGVPASITLAQAILESGWGNHHAGEANNYFGVKAQKHKDGTITYGDVATGYSTKTTQEYNKKTDKNETKTAYFRAYKGMSASFEDHGLFLRTNKRYKDALDNYAKSGDANAFAEGLQAAGYATDKNYANLLISVMRSNGLSKYNVQKTQSGGLP